jgi:hypothetical protein
VSRIPLKWSSISCKIALFTFSMIPLHPRVGWQGYRKTGFVPEGIHDNSFAGSPLLKTSHGSMIVLPKKGHETMTHLLIIFLIAG